MSINPPLPTAVGISPLDLRWRNRMCETMTYVSIFQINIDEKAYRFRICTQLFFPLEAKGKWLAEPNGDWYLRLINALEIQNFR